MQSKKAWLPLPILWLLFASVHSLSGQMITTPIPFDWQGHRGARGLMPENSIPAFLEALKYPVTTLELDLAVSRDAQLIVSHEPWMHPMICLDPEGNRIPDTAGHQHNLYLLTHEEICRYDCGSTGHPQFPRQQRLPVYKPTLAEVVLAVHASCDAAGRARPAWNIELKSREAGYDLFIPRPHVFVDLVLNEIDRLGITGKVTLQSFDLNVLREILRQGEDRVQISYLIEDIPSAEFAVEQLGFVPHIYSPNYLLVNAETISYARASGMRVIPWTVNTLEGFQHLISLGVDGIITDYPDLIEEYLSQQK